MREVGGQLPLVGEKLDDLIGHGVERDGGEPEFRRTFLRHAGPELPLAQFVRGGDEALGGLHHAYAEPVGDGHGPYDEGDTDPGQHQPRGGDPVGDLGLRHEHLDDGDAGADGDGLEPHGPAGHIGDGGLAEADVPVTGA